MSKNRASAIIPYNDGLVVIKRIKGKGEEKEEYYTIPGGGQEELETIQEATIREIREELGIEIKLTNKCYDFFVAEYKSGEIGSGKGDEMTNIDYEKYGAYIPEVIKKEEIENIRLLPDEIKRIIISDFNKIFK